MNRINELLPGSLNNVARGATLITGLLLLMLAHGLRRRKRRAWRAVVGLLAFTIVLHLIKSFGSSTAVVSLVLLGALMLFRDEFYAVGDPRTRWRALWVVAGSWSWPTWSSACCSSCRLRRTRRPSYSFAERTARGRVRSGRRDGPVHVPPDPRRPARPSRARSACSPLVTAYLFLRPAEPRAGCGRGREADPGAAGHQGSRDSLGYFALRRDKSVIWSPTGKACVTYRVVSGVMLASGDPIGDPEAWPGAIGAFLDEAARHAWAPAVMGCSELGAEVWCREGGL